MSELQDIKARFGIIGNYRGLNRALEKAMQVAPTDISVLVMGESGVGKEFIPKIIHSLSHRKHKSYIVVNCGAIPEGTIDSELFGHEKGAFTGATSTRKGYFEVADGGTIFLDEVGELPLQTQVRLLRVLESGEFMKVGSSTVQKTDVRIVAATNVNMMEAVQKGGFREDLYYRLNTVQIDIPPLRERREDIHLLFRKFAIDFAEKYRMPEITLTEAAVRYLENYPFPGNIRQLRNLVEQITVVEQKREITEEDLHTYIPPIAHLPMVVNKAQKGAGGGPDFSTEREILYKILFDMRNDINDLKSLTSELIKSGNDASSLSHHEKDLIERIYAHEERHRETTPYLYYQEESPDFDTDKLEQQERPGKHIFVEEAQVEEKPAEKESLSLMENEKTLIIKALEKHKGRRNKAADELGISQRTLYRKIKQYNLEE